MKITYPDQQQALGFIPVGTLTVTRCESAEDSLVTVVVPVNDGNVFDAIKDPAIESYYQADVPVVFAFETETAMAVFQNITNQIRRQHGKLPTHRAPGAVQ